MREDFQIVSVTTVSSWYSGNPLDISTNKGMGAADPNHTGCFRSRCCLRMHSPRTPVTEDLLGTLASQTGPYPGLCPWRSSDIWWVRSPDLFSARNCLLFPCLVAGGPFCARQDFVRSFANLLDFNFDFLLSIDLVIPLAYVEISLPCVLAQLGSSMTISTQEVWK